MTGRQTISYINDASGNKLEKKVEETVSGGVAKQTATDYINGMLYEQNVLQIIPHEEGRTRVDVQNSNVVYNNDFFIKGHLGNVTMRLSDEVYPVQVYQPTMEDTPASIRNTEISQLGNKVT